MRRLWAAVLRGLAVALFGSHNRCSHGRCTNTGDYAAPDAGPGGLCRDHVEAV